MSSKASWPRARTPSASAMPGERCPPVPPQLIIKQLTLKKSPTPIAQSQTGGLNCRCFGTWSLVGIWIFGIWDFHLSRHHLAHRPNPSRERSAAPRALGVEDDAEQQSHQQQIRQSRADER